MLLEGRSASEVATRLGCDRKWVYDVASRHQLPTNPSVKPGGRRELQIIRALVASNMDVVGVGKLFNQAPVNIEGVIKRMANR